MKDQDKLVASLRQTFGIDSPETRLNRSLQETFGRGHRGVVPIRRRSYAAAKSGRLLSSWSTVNTSANTDIFRSLRALRARSRQLANDNEWAKHFLTQVKANVVGPHGVKLQMRVRDDADATKQDRVANQVIEDHFRNWSKRGQCDVTGLLSRRDMENLFIETAARDGEVLVRKVRGYDNAQGYALQFLDTDHLDEQYNVDKFPDTGNMIRMSIEIDSWGRPVAYHLLTRHPGDYAYSYSLRGQTYERVPADEIVHAFLIWRPHQVRGVPWIHASMISLNDLGGYREAAIIAARVGASKMGFYKTPDGELGPLGEQETDDASGQPDGEVYDEVSPGHFGHLPPGYDFQGWDPTYPHEQFKDFNKAVLRGIASGCGMAYHTLSGDLESVNFSSARAGVLQEREIWMQLQNWMIESFHDAIFPDWLRYQLLAGNFSVKFPFAKFSKFNAPSWQPRRWPWVDPLKDAQAHKLAVDEGFKSRSDVIRESGRDPEEVWSEMKDEQDLLKSLGVVIKTAPGNTTGSTGGNDNAEDSDSQEN